MSLVDIYSGSQPPGTVSLYSENLLGDSNTTGGTYNAGQQGIFGLNPLMSPKYNIGQVRDAEYKDTMARLYVSLAGTGTNLQGNYLASLPQDKATQALANVLLGNNNGSSSGFIDFLLGSATESVQEVMQVEKVVADDYVAFFFGQAPPIFQYSGYLINSQQDDQRMSFYQAYSQILRGTALARGGALARLRYDSVLISGVMVAHQQQLLAENELAVPFSFSFLVKEYLIIQPSIFVHTDARDFVQLAAAQATQNLGSLQAPAQTQVRTAAVLSPSQAALSTAGAEPSLPVTPNTNQLQQTVQAASNAQQQDQLATQYNNVYGNVLTNSSIAPQAPYASFPGEAP
jgi:hypothetical protein